LPTPVRVSTQNQAATVMVTTSMVAPWANVSAALKPAFTMTGDTAVTEVLPVTQQIDSQAVSSVAASFGVGLPTSGTTSSNGQTSNATEGTNTANGKTTSTASTNGTTTSTTTTTTAPGVAPTPPSGTPANGQLPTAPALSGGLSLDPVLTHKAAAYLNQEVQLLNQEIDNAAVRECFVPYVVKLKLAVMNYKPYLAYSVHTRISFAPGTNGEYPPVDAELKKAALTLRAAGLLDVPKAPSVEAGASDKEKQEKEAQYKEALKDAAQKVQLAHTDARCLLLDHTPVVVPFLVADDMEVALKSRATQVAQQIAFALNLMVHGVGANAGLNNLNASLTAVSSQDLSSTLTVSRDNDSTLYVHIAPNNQASGEPTLVGQTYDVAVLLLVPRRYFLWRGTRFDPANISLVSYTQFRDATSGDILPRRPDNDLVTDLNRTLEPFISADDERQSWWKGLKPTDQINNATPLLEAIVAGSSDKFQAHLSGGEKCEGKTDKEVRDSLCFDGALAPSLWVGLSSVLSDNSYKSASFEAPIPPKMTVPSQNLLVSDDKTHPIQVAIGRVGGTSAASFAAHLDVVTQTPPGKSVVSIPATTLVLDPTAHVLTLTFPSLGKSGISLPEPPPVPPPAHPPAPKAGTIVPDDSRNTVLIERVNCDPYKALCPDLEAEDNAVEHPPDGTEVHPEIRLPVQFASMAKGTPNSIAKLAAAGSSIAIDRNASTGALPLLVTLPTPLPAGETFALTVSGAPVVSAVDSSNKALKFDKNGYGLLSTGSYTIQFINLTPGGTVTVSLQAFKDAGKTPDGDPATANFTAIPPTVSRP
jgi:hypothetical protein